MDYAKISEETFGFLFKSRASLSTSSLKASLRILAELRVSQINGCAYCCRLHTTEARKIGIHQDKLDTLAAWDNSPSFTEEEKVVLNWVEAVTYLDNLESSKEDLLQLLSEKECVDLTACVGIMNALNRIEIALKS